MTAVQLTVPGSKSMTQRALVQAFWTDPETVPNGVFVEGALDSDDPRALAEILSGLGANVLWGPEGVRLFPPVEPHGAGLTFDAGNAGTAVRFGAALALGVPGAYVIDGNSRMRERPLGPLIEALHSAGVVVEALGEACFPPVRLRGPAKTSVSSSGELILSVEGSRSSQFASALLLSAPTVPGGCMIRMPGDRVSRPYLTMTLEMMRSGGASISELEQGIRVESGSYRVDRYRIEPDASSAAFLQAAGLLLRRDVVIRGLLPAGRSLQGDAEFTRLAASLQEGAVEIDLGDVPDLLPPLSVLALCHPQTVTLTGISHTRIKECDRPAVLAEGFRSLGAEIEEDDDRLRIGRWKFSEAPDEVTLNPAGDHRMAMAFGLLQLRIPGLKVADPGCVSKSFPEFWKALSHLVKGQSIG